MGILTRGFYLGSKGVVVKKISVPRLVLRIVVSILISVLILLGALVFFKDSLIFSPVKGIDLDMSKTGWGFEEVWLKGSNGEKVNGWYLPISGAPTVLLLHGNGGNMEMMIGRIITYHKLGFTVMCIDYQGYGLSDGSPSEEATYQNAHAAWDFLTEIKNIPPEDILIHGFSLGGGVATELAYEKRYYKNPLVLDSTFTTLADAASFHVPLAKPFMGLILGDAYDSQKRLLALEPAYFLVLHSPQDEIVPFGLGLRLFESYLGSPREFVTLSGQHMNFIENQFLYAGAIQKLKETIWPKSRESALEP